MSRVKGFAKGAAAVVTVLLAIWGAITGTLAWNDQRRFDVLGRAESYVASGSANPIRITLVNRSQRPVSLVGGRVVLEGATLGHVTSATPTRAVGEQVRTAGELRAESQVLPLDLPPGSSFAGALFWDVSPAVSKRLLAKITLSPPEFSAGGDLFDEVFGAPQAVDVDVRVRLDFGGDDVEDVRLPVVRPSRFDGGYPELQFELRRARVVALQALPSAVLAPTIATLELWSERAMRSLRRVQRPLSPGEPARFPLPGLRDGIYTWALRYGGQTATGRFTTPCGGAAMEDSVGQLVPEDVCSAPR